MNVTETKQAPPPPPFHLVAGSCLLCLKGSTTNPLLLSSPSARLPLGLPPSPLIHPPEQAEEGSFQKLSPTPHLPGALKVSSPISYCGLGDPMWVGPRHGVLNAYSLLSLDQAPSPKPQDLVTFTSAVPEPGHVSTALGLCKYSSFL